MKKMIMYMIPCKKCNKLIESGAEEGADCKPVSCICFDCGEEGEFCTDYVRVNKEETDK